jgi:hypothetical protein
VGFAEAPDTRRVGCSCRGRGASPSAPGSEQTLPAQQRDCGRTGPEGPRRFAAGPARAGDSRARGARATTPPAARQLLRRLCTCAGPEDDAAEPDSELVEYASGARIAPLPTYFIGGFGRGSTRALAALEAGGGAGGVRYLGRAGLASLAGLAVAYLDGAQDEGPPAGGGAPGAGCRHFTQARSRLAASPTLL